MQAVVDSQNRFKGFIEGFDEDDLERIATEMELETHGYIFIRPQGKWGHFTRKDYAN